MDVLIPIAKSNKTDHLVFIDEVNSGLDCDCRCIACEVPLVARKGEINIHHFAHQAKKISEQRYCAFNFERSIFWMIRRILSQPHQINLPAYTIKFQDKLISDIFQKKVTEKHQVDFEKADFPQPLNTKNKTDVAILTISGYPLAITFCLHGSVKYSAYSWEISQPYINQGIPIAHLEISLTGLEKLFAQHKREYRNILENIIFISYASKSWLFHPNEKVYRREFAGMVRVEEERLKKVEIRSSPVKSVNPIVTSEINEESQTNILEQNRQSSIQEPYNNLVQPRTMMAISSAAPTESNLPPIHVQQKLLRDIKVQQTTNRLRQLVEQLTQFKYQGHSIGKRCESCYFMNSESSQQCEFCENDQLLTIVLDENYFDNVEHKYDCWCFAIYSLECLARTPFE